MTEFERYFPVDRWSPIARFAEPRYAGYRSSASLQPLYHLENSRVEQLAKNHPTLATFLDKFSGQLEKNYRPSLLMLRSDAPETCRTAEALIAFRDLASLSAVPLARARRLLYDRGEAFAYSTAFQFYPWMLDRHYQYLIMANPASMNIHLLSQFNGQSFPEQSQASLSEGDIDFPLAEALLRRWVTRFPQDSTAGTTKPCSVRSTWRTKRQRFLLSWRRPFMMWAEPWHSWVSAFEILAHPGGKGPSNFATVAEMMEKTEWLDPKLSAAVHSVVFKNKQTRTSAHYLDL